MNRGVEFAVGADERVGADGDASLVEEGAVRVDVDLLAEADAESVVAEEGVISTDEGARSGMSP